MKVIYNIKIIYEMRFAHYYNMCSYNNTQPFSALMTQGPYWKPLLVRGEKYLKKPSPMDRPKKRKANEIMMLKESAVSLLQ